MTTSRAACPSPRAAGHPGAAAIIVRRCPAARAHPAADRAAGFEAIGLVDEADVDDAVLSDAAFGGDLLRAGIGDEAVGDLHDHAPAADAGAGLRGDRHRPV